METRLDHIGNMIRRERLRRGLTQEELGARVGMGKSQISKIEGGKGLTLRTVTRVLEALHLQASVRLHELPGVDRKKIGYVVANIGAFARVRSLSVRDASNYLNRYKGLDFLCEHHEAEHLLSIDDSVEDLARVCRNHGGNIV